MFIDSKSSFKIWLTNLTLNLTILQVNQNNIQARVAQSMVSANQR